MADTLTEAATNAAANIQTLPVKAGVMDVEIGKMRETPLIAFPAQFGASKGILCLTENFILFAQNPYDFIAMERKQSVVGQGFNNKEILVQYTNAQSTGSYIFETPTQNDADMFIERSDPDAWTAEKDRLAKKNKNLTTWLRSQP